MGLKISNGFMSFEPAISSEWKEYEIKYVYGESVYNIIVHNLNGKNTGVQKVVLNGENVEDLKIKIDDCGGIFEVEVFI